MSVSSGKIKNILVAIVNGACCLLLEPPVDTAATNSEMFATEDLKFHYDEELGPPRGLLISDNINLISILLF